MNQDQINELLQALRCVTREHMRVMRDLREYEDSEERNITCVKEALMVLNMHQYKTNNPL